MSYLELLPAVDVKDGRAVRELKSKDFSEALLATNSEVRLGRVS
jgi:phosphoribosylformimino-5-aminoimidazole carboxamide ribonucleotide (ProFAR) isomerase